MAPHPFKSITVDEISVARDTVLLLHRDVLVNFREIFLQEPKKEAMKAYLESEHAAQPGQSPTSKRPPRLAKVLYDVIGSNRVPSDWQPFEYEFWREVHSHTLNFLKYFRAKWDAPGCAEFMDRLKTNVIDAGNVDINMLMADGENGVSMVLWVEHFAEQPASLLQLRRHALKWRKTHSGLSIEGFERIHTAVRETQERSQRRSPLSDRSEATSAMRS